ncbi:MAG TPA: NRDE family protein [Geminicoccus sp.]|uniref:NRDE family protein n=1 Tax=Geminicoccus sp. TaxID=2024832 RepID=UPI002BC3B754|nr:NRDE family protein [Geminicoccus sp.]HWL71075.1 NRDE family protein [Geminicoccus sp.]
MCTLVICRRPDHAWPLLVAANRDEMIGRPSAAPGRHWPDQPEILGGLDQLAGGSWLALSDTGVLAAMLNRKGTLGPLPGKRSRGELVLDAVQHLSAKDSASALAELDERAFRPFNLIVADTREAFWIRHAGNGPIRVAPVPDGVSMIDSGELNDPASPRIARFRGPFSADLPDPASGDWSGWRLLLATPAPAGRDPGEGLLIRRPDGYGTVSSSLVAIPADPAVPPLWLHADGPPDRVDFQPVATGTPRQARG